MSKSSKTTAYLTAYIPKPETRAKSPSGGGQDDRLLDFEKRLEELNTQLVKQNRDNQDARDNVDEDNLSENLWNIIKDLQARVTALEQIINTP